MVWTSPMLLLAGISIHTAQWLLGMPSPKARYPECIVWSISRARKIPSIGELLQLCVLGAFFLCCVMTTSTTPTCFVTTRIRSILMLSSYLLRLSLDLLHCAIVGPAWRSRNNCFLGHVLHPIPASPLTCCWYVVKCPLDLHGQYSTTILRWWFSLPCNLTQLHLLSPDRLLPGHVALWAHSFNTRMAVPPGWNPSPWLSFYCGTLSSGLPPTSHMSCKVATLCMVVCPMPY